MVPFAEEINKETNSWPILHTLKGPLDAIKRNYEVQPLNAFDENNAPIKAQQTMKKLREALVEVYFSLTHYVIRSGRINEQPFDSFTANIEQIQLLQTPNVEMESPIEKTAHKKPFRIGASVPSTSEQKIAARTFVPSPNWDTGGKFHGKKKENVHRFNMSTGNNGDKEGIVSESGEKLVIKVGGKRKKRAESYTASSKGSSSDEESRTKRLRRTET